MAKEKEEGKEVIVIMIVTMITSVRNYAYSICTDTIPYVLTQYIRMGNMAAQLLKSTVEN